MAAGSRRGRVGSAAAAGSLLPVPPGMGAFKSLFLGGQLGKKTGWPKTEGRGRSSCSTRSNFSRGRRLEPLEGAAGVSARVLSAPFGCGRTRRNCPKSGRWAQLPAGSTAASPEPWPSGSRRLVPGAHSGAPVSGLLSKKSSGAWVASESFVQQRI